MLRLASATRWLFDGTFKIQPRLFQQLFSVHTKEGSSSILPCVYAPLAYISCCDRSQYKCPENNYKGQLRTTSDFAKQMPHFAADYRKHLTGPLEVTPLGILQIADLDILRDPCGWINDTHIHAAQILLKEAKPLLDGLNTMLR